MGRKCSSGWTTTRRQRRMSMMINRRNWRKFAARSSPSCIRLELQAVCPVECQAVCPVECQVASQVVQLPPHQEVIAADQLLKKSTKIPIHSFFILGNFLQ